MSPPIRKTAVHNARRTFVQLPMPTPSMTCHTKREKEREKSRLVPEAVARV